MIGKTIGVISIVIVIIAGAWLYVASSQSSKENNDATVTEPIDDARDLEERATTPRVGQTIE